MGLLFRLTTHPFFSLAGNLLHLVDHLLLCAILISYILVILFFLLGTYSFALLWNALCVLLFIIRLFHFLIINIYLQLFKLLFIFDASLIIPIYKELILTYLLIFLSETFAAIVNSIFLVWPVQALSKMGQVVEGLGGVFHARVLRRGSALWFNQCDSELLFPLDKAVHWAKLIDYRSGLISLIIWYIYAESYKICHETIAICLRIFCFIIGSELGAHYLRSIKISWSLLGILTLAYDLLSKDDLSEHFDFLFLIYGMNIGCYVTVLAVLKLILRY